jgi:hypothetical protein
MQIEIRNRCSDFNSYRAARVKSLFNAESGCKLRSDRGNVDIIRSPIRASTLPDSHSSTLAAPSDN